jgi:hypothetical protein
MPKYAEICKIYARNMQVYARPQINSVLQKNARNMQNICTYLHIYASPTLLIIMSHVGPWPCTLPADGLSPLAGGLRVVHDEITQ